MNGTKHTEYYQQQFFNDIVVFVHALNCVYCNMYLNFNSLAVKDV